MSHYVSPKKRKKRMFFWRRVLLLMLLIAMVLSICLFTPFFHIKTVEVRGNELIASEQILEAASVPLETNIFRISKKNIKKSVMMIPEIENVEVRRILPSKVRLNVTETKPVLYFPYLSGYAVTNENGRVLSLVDTADDLNLIKITGLEIKSAEIYKKISVQDTVTFDIMISSIQFFNEKGLLPQIRSCHYDSLAEFYVHLTDGTKVIFGKTTDMEYKLSVLAEVLMQVDRGEGTFIDLSTPERAFSGTFDPAKQPSPSPEPSPEAGAEGSASENPDGEEDANA